MKANDVKNKNFKKKVSGYDRQAVDDFLKDVARTMDNLETDNQRLQQELYERNAELDEFHKKSETLNRSIVVAQEAADRLRNAALDEAETIVKQAEETAQDILTQAAQNASEVNRESNRLQEAARMYLHQSLGMAIQAKEMFENPRWAEYFDQDPSSPVETPVLDSILADLDLPVRNHQGQDILANQEKVVEKEQEKEAFFNNDKPAVLSEEAQRILQSQGEQALYPEAKVPSEEEAANSSHTSNEGEKIDEQSNGEAVELEVTSEQSEDNQGAESNKSDSE